MSTLITGASGMLGSSLAFHLQQRREAVGLVARRHHVRLPGAATWAVDLSVPGSSSRIVGEFAPTSVVHCAAYTDVDWCETHGDEACALHVAATAELASAAAKGGAAFVYISTDSVFDGDCGGYDENSQTAPLNVYAQTKLAGEQAARDAHPGALIVRTSIFGWNPVNGRGLAEWLAGRLSGGETAGGFGDVIFTPILANDLAEIISLMIDREMIGLYHVGGGATVSKLDFGRQLARSLGYDERLITPARVQDHQFAARRPRDTSLVSAKVQDALKRSMPDLESGLRRLRCLRESGWADQMRAVMTTGIPAR